MKKDSYRIDDVTCENLQMKILKYAVLILTKPKEFRPFQKKLDRYYEILERMYLKCEKCSIYNVEKNYCALQKNGIDSYIRSLEQYFRYTGLMKIMNDLERRYLNG